MTTASFAVTVEGSYSRMEIPPRCRVERRVNYDIETVVYVPNVTAKDAPVAFRIHKTPEAIMDIRLHNNQLFQQAWIGMEPVNAGSALFPDIQQGRHLFPGEADNAEDYQAVIQQDYQCYLIVDNELWTSVGEPRYLVTSNGIGGVENNGTTTISAELNHRQWTAGENYFRADEFTEAVEFAIQSARSWGHFADAQRFADTPETFQRIEVLIADAVTLKTPKAVPAEVAAMRREYKTLKGTFMRAEEPDAEEEAYRALSELREKIHQAGFPAIRDFTLPVEQRHQVDNAANA